MNRWLAVQGLDGKLYLIDTTLTGTGAPDGKVVAAFEPGGQCQQAAVALNAAE
jgi:hypothetical protein